MESWHEASAPFQPLSASLLHVGSHYTTASPSAKQNTDAQVPCLGDKAFTYRVALSFSVLWNEL